MAARSAMTAVVKTLLEQVKSNEGLRDLLVKTEHEDQRPRLRIGGDDHIVGLVDEKVMLLRESDRMLVNPEILGDGGVTEIVWRLK